MILGWDINWDADIIIKVGVLWPLRFSTMIRQWRHTDLDSYNLSFSRLICARLGPGKSGGHNHWEACCCLNIDLSLVSRCSFVGDICHCVP